MQADEQQYSQRYPSEEVVRALAEAGREVRSIIVSIKSYSCDHLCEEEAKLANSIAKLYDVTGPLKDLADNDIIGWDFKTRLALCGIREALRELANSVGLQWLLTERDARHGLWIERESKWIEAVERPFYDAARSFAKGFTLTRSIDIVLHHAEQAEAKGYPATLSPEEGEARYTGLRDAWRSTNCLGTVPYELDERGNLDNSTLRIFSNAITILEDATVRLPCPAEPPPPFIRCSNPSLAPVEPSRVGTSYYKTVGGVFRSFDYEKAELVIEESQWKGFSFILFVRLKDGNWLKGEANKQFPKRGEINLMDGDETLPRTGHNFRWRQVEPNVVIEFCEEQDHEIPLLLLWDSEEWHAPKSSDAMKAPKPIGSDTAGVSESARMGKVPSRKLPIPETLEEREKLVEEFLRDNPTATSGQVALATKIPEGRVRNLDSWKDHRRLRTKQSRTTRELTDEILAVRGSRNDNPSDIAAAKELAEYVRNEKQSVEEGYLSHANPNEQRIYKQANEERKFEILIRHLQGTE